jgi:hypothetical protein
MTIDAHMGGGKGEGGMKQHPFQPVCIYVYDRQSKKSDSQKIQTTNFVLLFDGFL